MKLGRRNYQIGFSLSGLVSECSPGEIQEVQLVHAVETNNFQPSHVGFSSSQTHVVSLYAQSGAD